MPHMLCRFVLVSIVWTVAGCTASATLSPADVAVPASPWPDYSFLELRNEHVALLVMEPDEAHGFNRASRFDRSGMVVLAQTAEGHRFFGPVRDPEGHDPARDDHVAGTAEEFDMQAPPGYDAAAAGEGFVKIGVGVLQRTDEEDYFFREDYPMLDPGRWRIEREADQVVFTHDLEGPGGYAYRYTKQVRLLAEQAGFVITRTLANTGERVIRTRHYGHHFVRIDGAAPGPGYTLSFGFDAEPGEGWRDEGRAVWRDGTLAITEPVAGGSIWGPVVGYDPAQPAHHAVTVRHAAGGSVTFEGDRGLDELVFYSGGEAVCPEPFVALTIEPGERERWRTTYTFGE
ncbi:MAG: hypothetical protein WD534_05355 [Phycisphaeraceae bacterium]